MSFMYFDDTSRRERPMTADLPSFDGKKFSHNTMCFWKILVRAVAQSLSLLIQIYERTGLAAD